MNSNLIKCNPCLLRNQHRILSPLSHDALHPRSFVTSHRAEAGGKNKIKVTGKGRLKDHPLGGPGMEEAFDIERDLVKPFAMQDVPAVTHLRWAEARKRLHALRVIKFQMPSLASSSSHTEFLLPLSPPSSQSSVCKKF